MRPKRIEGDRIHGRFNERLPDRRFHTHSNDGWDSRQAVP